MSIQLNDTQLLKTQAYINGCWINANDGSTFPVTNPATGEVIAQAANCSREETRTAIEAANQALGGWQKLAAKERSIILRRWYDLIMASQEDLTKIMTAEQGKVLAESRAEIAYGGSFIEWFAEEAKRVYGDVIPAPQTDRQTVHGYDETNLHGTWR